MFTWNILIRAQLYSTSTGDIELGRHQSKPFVILNVAVTALTHITRIRRDFDVANSPRYRDDNTLPHIAHFRGEIQDSVQK